MKVEFMINRLDHEWWFDLGISCQFKSRYNKRGVIAIGLIVASLYFRW